MGVVRLPRAVLTFFALRDVRFDVCEPPLNLGEAGAHRGEFPAARSFGAGLLARPAFEPTRDALGQLPHPVLLAAAHR
jgi:hypothetical protein